MTGEDIFRRLFRASSIAKNPLVSRLESVTSWGYSLSIRGMSDLQAGADYCVGCRRDGRQRELGRGVMLADRAMDLMGIIAVSEIRWLDPLT
jgi:hypothetical protein